MASSKYEVGRHVKLMLKSKIVVEGTIFALDPDGKRLVLEEVNSGDDANLRNVRVVNLASVENAVFETVAPLSIVAHLPALSKDLALKREKATFRAKEEALLRTASPYDIKDLFARSLYESFSKTMECTWHERDKRIDIKELGVSIKYPFRDVDVVGQDLKAVKRVRDMLAKMRPSKN